MDESKLKKANEIFGRISRLKESLGFFEDKISHGIDDAIDVYRWEAACK